ncbi:hypothetical protein PF010_g6519 [Phytophthora fragariae]|uniref:Uncharacterized protein n=1 Tax=Phytophthora fragariae TaxID=53985 RepID=A0A6G0PD42_9STRA|nr:hypothetical protein PF010_g6519 [Phytophthora fragariae]KAE9243221.1 hypothetical protein PF004_g6246 [Phytophthora fragariae]
MKVPVRWSTSSGLVIIGQASSAYPPPLRGTACYTELDPVQCRSCPRQHAEAQSSVGVPTSARGIIPGQRHSR